MAIRFIDGTREQYGGDVTPFGLVETAAGGVSAKMVTFRYDDAKIKRRDALRLLIRMRERLVQLLSERTQ